MAVLGSLQAWDTEALSEWIVPFRDISGTYSLLCRVPLHSSGANGTYPPLATPASYQLGSIVQVGHRLQSRRPRKRQRSEHSAGSL
jgi:hypothetical protein